MKRESLYNYLCATVISLCLGLGAVGSMVSGLKLPVQLGALIILCLVLAALIAGIGRLRHSGLILCAIGIIFLWSPDFLIQLKTVAAAVALRLQLAYSIPIPEILQGKDSDQILPALCFLAGLIMALTAWAVQKQKTAIPAALLSLIPLACCITVTDSVPDSVWLFLWGLGLILLLMPQGVRLKSVPRGNRLTALLLIPTALVLLFLFWLIPRDAPNRWSIADLPQQLLSHFSDTAPDIPDPQPPSHVDLSVLGERWQKQTPVMEVTADFTGALYLRGRDYDEYTGTGWHSTDGRTEVLYGFDSLWHEKDGAVEISLRQSQDFYYLPAITQEAQRITNGQAKNPTGATTYRFDHCSMRSDWQDTWKDPFISTVSPRYLALPDNTLLGAQAYLDKQAGISMDSLSNIPTPVLAEQLRLLLREHVPYDLSTPKMPSEATDLALWFLDEAESGYCVHFATAAVVLLRACGIPARYVEGYAIHVQADKTVTVRELHAHAWAEYYVTGVGWLVLEATPSSNTVPDEPATSEPETTTAPTAAPNVSHTGPTGTDTNPEQPTKAPPIWVAMLLRILLWLLIASVLLWLQYRLRRFRFCQSIRRSSPNRRALVIHHRLCRLSKWTKQPVPTEVTQLAQKARFSNHTLTAPELARLQGHLGLAEAAISHLPFPQRLIAKWLFARY